MRHTLLLSLSALLLSACGSTQIGVTPGVPPGAGADGSYTPDPAFTQLRAPITPDRWLPENQQMLDSINAARTRGSSCTEADGSTRAYPSAPPVRFEGHLQRAATWHAHDMNVRNYMGHMAPAPAPHGISPLERILKAGYLPPRGVTTAENLASTSGASTPESTVDGIVTAWLSSHSGHCQALMNPASVDIGIWRENGYWATEYAAPGQ